MYKISLKANFTASHYQKDYYENAKISTTCNKKNISTIKIFHILYYGILQSANFKKKIDKKQKKIYNNQHERNFFRRIENIAA